MSSVRYIAAFRSTAAFAVVLTISAVQTERASASCGDYLVHQTQSSAAANTSHLLRQNASGKTDKNQQLPCRGANCRNAPSLPPTPVPIPTASVQVEQWGFLDSSSFDLNSERGDRVADHYSAMNNGHPRRVDRPPQFQG